MTRFLASVRSLDEAHTAAAAGADIIDLKAPDRGSLGALPLAEIATVAAALRDRKPTSATVGDLPMEPERVAAAVAATLATGVDYVKIGLYPGGDAAATVRRVGTLAGHGRRLIAVLFADQTPWRLTPAELAAAGFAGCMLDTLDKHKGSLTAICPLRRLRRFVAEARDSGLLCGLAGSLSAADIETLLPLQPDYLGFRGALCRDRRRTDRLDEAGVRRIAALIAAGRTSDRAAVTPLPSPSITHDPLEEIV